MTGKPIPQIKPRHDVTARHCTIVPVLNEDKVIIMIWNDPNKGVPDDPDVSLEMTYDHATKLYAALGVAIEVRQDWLDTGGFPSLVD